MSTKKIVLATSSLLTLLLSCQDDAQDEEPPIISITAPSTGHQHWHDVKVSAEVTDNHQVAYVVFCVDGQPLSKDTEAPYEATFDSKHYQDGAHSLKATAFDEAGNSSIATQKVDILNTLTRIKVDNNYFDRAYLRDTWVVITDNQGNHIETITLENGTDVSVMRPTEMDSGNVRVLEIRHIFFEEGNEYMSISEFQNIVPDGWLMKYNTSDLITSDTVGVARVQYTVAENDDDYLSVTDAFLQENSAVDDGKGNINKEYGLTLWKQPIGALLTIYNEEKVPYYTWASTIWGGLQ